MKYANISEVDGWNEPVDEYFIGALIVFIILIPHTFINVYFFNFTFKNEYLLKQNIIRYNILIFSILYLLAGVNTMVLEGEYLYAYFTNTKIHFWSCSVLRTLQQVTLFPICTSVFILSLQRFLSITYSINLKWKSILLIFIILNSLSYINFYLTIFEAKYAIVNEICGYYPVQPHLNLLYASTFLTALLPIAALITNFCTLYLLRRKYKLLKHVIKYEDHKRVLINLSIQSFLPCVSNSPVFACFFYQIYAKTEIPPIVWRIIDGIHYTQYSTSTFITLISIKEIQETFFNRRNAVRNITIPNSKNISSRHF
uniref:G_PROTEIN_RECEP_F1_2 domain-containing protein n=1 Tax=Strongyloides papillosus TaxID=174720 RepID=A0A0N5B8S2_STREA